jgi:hypothetical protein
MIESKILRDFVKSDLSNIVEYLNNYLRGENVARY